ncbi:MAG: ferrous iron transport protein B, partial [Anaerolinea sp.]|nr:ferrous iron transport protein B [Anaerolinea sp.]
HVGNWPGKTVEKKEGRLTVDRQDVLIVDLPGTYSLSAYSTEEIIARDFLLREHPGLVVAVIDAANLERNLYLACQIAELDRPLILALNMADTARSRGLSIDATRLSAELGGIPVIETVGTRGIGLDALRAAIAGQRAAQRPDLIDYGPALEAAIADLMTAAAEQGIDPVDFPPRWLALKLLENDAEIAGRLADRPALLARARTWIDQLTAELGDDPETLLTDRRYGFIGAVVSAAVTRRAAAAETASDRADRILTHRLFGLPIFLLLMWTAFQITANVSAPLIDWVDGVFGGPVSRWVAALLGALGLSGSWIESLLLNGVIAGVGGVLTFVPLLILLYITIGVLEDSGYMARAAFVMDRVMRVVGLHGKSFLPLLVGFGCTVPAIYATRTLEGARDRRLTGFISTFMSCGARLPVYVLFAGVFFGAQAGTVIFALYLLGIGVALVTGLILQRLFSRRDPQPFVLELPPYRVPDPGTVLRQTWGRTRGFLHAATTIILLTSIGVWLLTALPADLNLGRFNAVEPQESLFGAVSGALAPIFAPAGFSDWRAAGSLVTGFVAKEVIISTMSQIYGAEETGGAEADAEPAPTLLADIGAIAASFGRALVLTGQELINIVPRTVNLIPGAAMPEADWLGIAADEKDTSALSQALRTAFTPLSAIAIMVFVLLYSPCMTATAALRHEFGGRFTLYQIAYTTAVAWLAAMIVYQGGLLLGLGR